MNQNAYSFDVSAENFNQLVLENSRTVPVLVDFWAPWCGPCQSLMPMLTKLAEEYAGAFLLAKVNIDEQPELAAQFGVRSVPTVKLVSNGQIADEFMGALPEGQIREFLGRYISNEAQQQLDELMARFRAGDIGVYDELAAIAEQQPDNHQVTVALAQLKMAKGEYAEASQLLQRLPEEQCNDPEVAGMYARLAFAQAIEKAPSPEALMAHLEQHPDDSEAQYQLSLHLIVGGNYEAGMEGLLALMQRDPGYGDGAARKALLQSFELVGSGALVNRFRSRLFALLH